MHTMINTRLFQNTRTAFRYRSLQELRNSKILFATMASPLVTRLGIGFTNLCLQLSIPVKAIIKSTIFRQFCGGENLAEAIKTAGKISEYNVSAILDYGVEQKQHQADFDRTKEELIKAIKYAASQKRVTFISIKPTAICRFALLEDLHAGRTLSETESREWQKAYDRLLQICEAAEEHDIKVLIDAEETWIQEPVNDLAEKMMARFNKERALVYNTFQMYCTGSLDFLVSSLLRAQYRGYQLGVKLVRGAYMEKERARAAEMNYPSPIQPGKEATDKDFDQAVSFCFRHLDQLALFIGTHNEDSCARAVQIMETNNIPADHPKVHFSQLYGMSDHISFNLAGLGYNVAKYLPYGPVEDIVPYLMRRAEENTSVAGQSGRELVLIKRELKRRALEK